MIEIRMFHRAPDQYIGNNERIVSGPKTPVLQYRQKNRLTPGQQQANGVSGLGQQFQPQWSEWTDVPDVYESEDGG